MKFSRTFFHFRRYRANLLHRLVPVAMALSALVSTVSSVLPAWAAQAEAALSDSHIITLVADGETTTHLAGQETVGELLERLDVEVGTYDSLYPRAGAVIAGDLTITLERASVTYETILEPLPFDTLYEEDDTLPLGSEELVQEGVNGIHCSYYQNIVTPEGVTYRRLVRSGVKTWPTDEIIAQGTAEPVTKNAPVEEPPAEQTPSQSTETEAAPEVSSDNTITTAGGEVLTYSKVLTCTATAYTASPGALTATGTTPRVGAIAVDPKVIPYGTRMYIVTSDGSIVYGHAVAEDCGGAIKGNRVDLYYNSYDECIQFGRRQVTVYILD